MEDKILDHTGFDYKNSVIIKPPFSQPTNKEIGKQFTRIVIDSRDRDINLYPTPSKYVYHLDQDIEEVTSAEVIIMDVPLSGYIINNNNNVLTIIWPDDFQQKIIIPVGNYDGPRLAEMLQNLINDSQITYNPVQDNITFYGYVPFSLDFTSKDSKAIAAILGFSKGIYVSPVTSTYRINLNVNNYVVMNIEQFNINISSNNVIDRTTALIHYKPISINYVSFANMQIKKFFNPPIARLNKLKLSFMDYYGNPYDFQNQDHRIEILFESKKNLSRYTHYV